MRYTMLFCGLAVLGWNATVEGQVGQWEISQPSAEVRCLATDQGSATFVTNILKKGDSVNVVGEPAVGWLAIVPPSGSFSWVNKKDLVVAISDPTTYIVNNPQGTETVIGSSVDSAKKGTVRGAKLPYGTQVKTVQRAPLQDTDGTWLAITPPPGNPQEQRYLRKEAVTQNLIAVAASEPASYATTTPGTRTSYAQPSPNNLPPYVPGTIPPPTPLSEAQKLWQQAQHAERAGDLNQAMDLYSQMAMRTPSNSFDHELAMQGLNRVYFLRESQRSPVMNTVPAIQAGQPPTLVSNEARYNGQPVGNPAVKLATPMTSTGSSFLPANPYPPSPQQPTVGSNNPTPNPSPWQPAPQSARNMYSTPCVGRLIRAGRAYRGRKTYIFMQQNTEPGHDPYRCYASPQTGIDLEPYLDKNVELIGQAEYNGELRANYMIVEQVRVVP